MATHTLLLLSRQTPEFGIPGWPEVVAGYDFSFLPAAEVQRWLRLRGARGEAGARLVALAGPELLEFEACMWAACAEEIGEVPRPGTRAWAAAQDRWRKALLREALAEDLTEAALAAQVESVYDRVGCPEDMLGLWRYRAPWQEPAPAVDFRALSAFLGVPSAGADAVA